MKQAIPALMCVQHYLGVAFRRAFVVWFASGIVMVFKRMPEYTRGSGLRAYGGCDGMHSLTLLALTSWRAQYVSK
jgi:hypothetical protein